MFTPRQKPILLVKDFVTSDNIDPIAFADAYELIANWLERPKAEIETKRDQFIDLYLQDVRQVVDIWLDGKVNTEVNFHQLIGKRLKAKKITYKRYCEAIAANEQTRPLIHPLTSEAQEQAITVKAAANLLSFIIDNPDPAAVESTRVMFDSYVGTRFHNKRSGAQLKGRGENPSDPK